MTPTGEYIDMICRIYGDRYDDQEEDSRPGGNNWRPGVRAAHKSIQAFQKELADIHGIRLSRSKIQKILVSGKCWTTEGSREVQRLFEELTEQGGNGLQPEEAIQRIAEHLNISTASVYINLPYRTVMYGLEEKSENAKRIIRSRERKKGNKNA